MKEEYGSGLWRVVASVSEYAVSSE